MRGGGGRLEMNKRSDQALRTAKTEETVSHRQNNNIYVKAVGTPPVRNNLIVYFANCYSINTCAEQIKSQRQCPKKQLLKNNSAARQTIQLGEPSSTSLT